MKINRHSAEVLCFLLALFCQTSVFCAPPGPDGDLFLPFDRGADSLPGTDFVPHIDWDPLFNIDEYEIGPGDIFNLHGAGGKNMSTKIYVSPSYEVFIPAVGPLSVKGMKIRDLKKSIFQRVRPRYPGIELMVVPYKLHEFKVQFTGEVNKPGSKITPPGIRLHEFLQAAGGLREVGSRIGIVIENGVKKTKKVVNYQSYLLGGDLSGNPFIESGDSIFVPIQKNIALIKGNVVRESRFEFAEASVSLKKVVEENLGGFISSQGISGQVVISRLIDGKNISRYIAAEEFFKERGEFSYSTYELLNGDQVYFPTASIKNPGILSDQVFITGEVKNALPLPYKPGLAWGAYIAAAGGVTSRANNDQIMIYKASGSMVSISESPTIEPGDTIYVPEKTFKFWQDHITILMTFLSLVTTTIAISR